MRSGPIRPNRLAAKTSGFRCGRRAAEQAFRAQVFINIRPVNPIACSAYFPARSLFHGCAQEPRIPCQGNDDGAAVREVHRQCVLSDVYVSYAFSGIKMGSVHTISPTEDCDSLPLAGGLAEAPPGRTQGFWPAQPGPARTLPTDRRDPRAHGEARLAHGCKNIFDRAPPSVWLAAFQYLTVIHSDSRCAFVNPLPVRRLHRNEVKHHFPLSLATTRYLSDNMTANPLFGPSPDCLGYSVKTSCSVLKAVVSVFAGTAPNFVANLTLSTARI